MCRGRGKEGKEGSVNNSHPRGHFVEGELRVIFDREGLHFIHALFVESHVRATRIRAKNLEVVVESLHTEKGEKGSGILELVLVWN
jgi:hypothetical protein